QCVSFLLLRRPRSSTPFPYTTLFRSQQVENGIERIQMTMPALMQLAQGGTAVGTGLNAPVGFAEKVAERIAAITHMPFTSAPNKDRKSTRLNSSHVKISYAVFCLKKK